MDPGDPRAPTPRCVRRRQHPQPQDLAVAAHRCDGAGISSALHERTEVDTPRARFLNNNIAEYLIPVNADIGELRAEIVPETDTSNQLGVKGLGQLSCVGTAAAIGNAIYHATGKRLRELPFTIANVV